MKHVRIDPYIGQIVPNDAFVLEFVKVCGRTHGNETFFEDDQKSKLDEYPSLISGEMSGFSKDEMIRSSFRPNSWRIS